MNDLILCLQQSTTVTEWANQSVGASYVRESQNRSIPRDETESIIYQDTGNHRVYRFWDGPDTRILAIQMDAGRTLKTL